MEGGLLMWPDMKDRLTLSVYWKKLKIYNTKAVIIVYDIHTHYICMQDITYTDII